LSGFTAVCHYFIVVSSLICSTIRLFHIGALSCVMIVHLWYTCNWDAKLGFWLFWDLH